MGLAPAEVDGLSLWQYRAVLAGWALANGAEVEAELGAEEFDAAVAALDAAPDTTT